ncbi:MAG: hypothetical protein IT210_08860 [Armatimonadetes bacterium]|nr:hypothetical protein [Armatimonadota bacterium]
MRKPLPAPPGQRNLPFDFDDLMALWAPRPVFFNEVSQEQEHWNNARQTAQAVLELRKLYRFLGAEERFYAYYIDSTHDFNP